MITDTTERGLESLIVQALTTSGAPPSGRVTLRDRTQPYGLGWIEGDPKDYDRDHAVDLVQLLAFLRVTQPEVVEQFDLDNECASRAKFLARLQGEITRRHARIRMQGSTGTDMAYVAAGHLAGAVSYGRHPWDHAAGVALVRAAGGIATDIFGRPWTVQTPSLVAAAPGVHAELLEVIAAGEWPQPQTLTF